MKARTRLLLALVTTALLIALASPPAASGGPSERSCLLSAVFYEARNQSVSGMKAITEVVQNRARIRGKTICEVISEKGQWSWFKHKQILSATHKKIKIDIDEVLRQDKVVGTEAEYFHNDRVKPKWVKHMVFVKKVGNHSFYKELS